MSKQVWMVFVSQIVIVLGLICLYHLQNISVVSLKAQIEKVDSKVDKVNEIKVKVPDTLTVKLENEFDRIYKTHTDQIHQMKVAYDGVVQRDQAEFSKSHEAYINLIATTQKNIADLAKQQEQEVCASIKRGEDKYYALLEDQLIRSKKEAENAFQEAQKALSDQKRDLAKIYVLNAINHLPGEVKYVMFYYSLVMGGQTVGVPELQQLANVLDSVVYQIKAQEVPEVIKMKESVMDRSSKIAEETAQKTQEENKRNLQDVIATLESGRIALNVILSKDSNSVKVGLLRERMETLESILSDSLLSAEETRDISDKLKTTTTIYSIAVALESVERVIQTAKKTLPPAAALSGIETTRARNQLQTAVALLAQVWSADDYPVAVSLFQKAKEYQVQISDINKKLDVHVSAEAIQKVKQALDEIRALPNKGGSYTPRINRITELSKEIASYFPQIVDAESQANLLKEAACVPDVQTWLSKARYTAYQEWARERLKGAITQYKKYDTKMSVTKEEAKEIFNNYFLDIDPSLLVADIQTLYGSIYRFVYDKLEEDKAEMEYNKAKHDSKKLEDF